MHETKGTKIRLIPEFDSFYTFCEFLLANMLHFSFLHAPGDEMHPAVTDDNFLFKGLQSRQQESVFVTCFL